MRALLLGLVLLAAAPPAKKAPDVKKAPQAKKARVADRAYTVWPAVSDQDPRRIRVSILQLNLPDGKVPWEPGASLYLASDRVAIAGVLKKVTPHPEHYPRTTLELEVPKGTTLSEAKPDRWGHVPFYVLAGTPIRPAEGVEPIELSAKDRQAIDQRAALGKGYESRPEWILSFRVGGEDWMTLPFHETAAEGEFDQYLTLVFRRGKKGWEPAGRMGGQVLYLMPDVDGDGVPELGGYDGYRSTVVWAFKPKVRTVASDSNGQ